MPLVAHAQVSISARGGHEEAAPAQQPIMDARDRVDDTAIKRKQKQVLEARREVPTRPWLVEDAVAGHGAVLFESRCGNATDAMYSSWIPFRSYRSCCSPRTRQD